MKIINLCPFCDQILPNREQLKDHVISCNRTTNVSGNQIQKLEEKPRVEVIRIRSIQNFEAPEGCKPGHIMQQKNGSLIRINKIKNFHI